MNAKIQRAVQAQVYKLYLQKKLRWPFVYVIRKRALGDVLWIEPVIRELSKRYKKVIVFTKFNELFAHYPIANVQFKNKLNFFEKTFAWIAQRWRHVPFFINLDMTYEHDRKRPLLHAYQAAAQLPLTEDYPRLYLSELEITAQQVPFQRYVVLHLESLTDKNYRKVFGIDWKQTVEYLKREGFAVIQIGKDDMKIEGSHFKKTSLRELIALIARSSFFIGLDSGPSHIAASFGIPSLIFFGAVNPHFRHFRSKFKGFFLQQFCEFAGCYHDVLGINGPDCKLVGNAGIPKCSLHSNEYLIEHINKLLSRYAADVQKIR